MTIELDHLEWVQCWVEFEMLGRWKCCTNTCCPGVTRSQFKGRLICLLFQIAC